MQTHPSNRQNGREHQHKQLSQWLAFAALVCFSLISQARLMSLFGKSPQDSHNGSILAPHIIEELEAGHEARHEARHVVENSDQRSSTSVAASVRLDPAVKTQAASPPIQPQSNHTSKPRPRPISSKMRLQQRKSARQPWKSYCLSSFSGQHSNRVLTLARLLAVRAENRNVRSIALDKGWTDWFREHFDDREGFLYNDPHTSCFRRFRGRGVFYMHVDFAPYLATLLPKKIFQEEADRYVDAWEYGRNFISVHRRNLDDKCIKWATCAAPISKEQSSCLTTPTCTVADRVDACNMNYTMIDNPSNLKVVLFTDRQAPELDNTFPIHFNTSSVSNFLVEILIMAKSETHWGNPLSSVDVLVHHWRNGLNTQPKQCSPIWQNYMNSAVLEKIE